MLRFIVQFPNWQFGITAWSERASLVEEKLTFTLRSSQQAVKLLQASFGSLSVAPTALFASKRTAEDLRASPFLGARAILDIRHQTLLIILLFNGANLLGINSSLMKTGYCKSSNTMCGDV